jgi:hypothetical protein
MRTKHQKTAYAFRRMSLAVDRLIVTKDERHKKWVTAWARRAMI